MLFTRWIYPGAMQHPMSRSWIILTKTTLLLQQKIRISAHPFGFKLVRNVNQLEPEEFGSYLFLQGLAGGKPDEYE